MAASGDEEKQNLGEETTSLLKLKEEIGNQKASFEAFQIEVKSLLAHKLKEEIGNQKASVEALQIEVRSLRAHKSKEEITGNNQKASVEALQLEVKSLRAHVRNTDNVLRPTSSSAVNQDSDTENDLLYTLPSDTFTLMMVYKPLTPAWNIGVFSFIFQILILMLIMLGLVLDQGEVPFTVDNKVRIGQYAVTFLCLLSQDDVLTSLQSICVLWKCDCTAFQDLFVSGHDLSASGHDIFADHDDVPNQAFPIKQQQRQNDHYFYALHILLPNLLKLAQGVFVLLVSFMVIVQSNDLVDLLKDSTALFFVSAIDNVVFFYATAGFFGQKVGRQAQATTGKVIADVKKWTFIVRPIVMIIIGSLMIIALFSVQHGQNAGYYFAYKYPDCFGTEYSKNSIVTAISNMTNGVCDGGELNTLECDFDGGDCINHNLAFPGCNVNDPEKFLGNYVCDGGLYNTPECKYDNGDCDLFNSYPNCDIPDPDQLDDGTCNTTSPYNSILCGFDGGDCVDDVNERQCSGIKSVNITELGDGKCNARNNNQACGWDGKDCLEFNAKYPVCGVTYKDIDPERVGDGKCDNFGGYNSLACGNDGSDCSNFNLQYPQCEGENLNVIGDGNCDPECDNVECGFDGYDCDPTYLDCSNATISALCDDLRSRYPNCTLANKNAYRLGNFDCDSEFNMEECGFDGGDCGVVPNYPGCRVGVPEWIGDGRCDGGGYNTTECGFDGGDCLD
eukprot:scaffold454_cov146-Chaetoceros_neogracile.AAC.2